MMICVALASCFIQRGPSSGRVGGVDGRMEGARGCEGGWEAEKGAKGGRKTSRLTCVLLLPLAMLVLALLSRRRAADVYVRACDVCGVMGNVNGGRIGMVRPLI